MIEHNRSGIEISANVWFEHADPALQLREMKIHAEQYGVILTLLRLPRLADVWAMAPPPSNIRTL